MRPLFLLDTDWAIHYLRGKRTDIIARLRALAPHGLAISIISLAELYRGVYQSAQREKNLHGLEDFLAGVEIIFVDEEVARRFGQESAALKTQGIVIDGFDLLIGCTALVHHLTLLSNNRRHFDPLRGLTIESA